MLIAVSTMETSLLSQLGMYASGAQCTAPATRRKRPAPLMTASSPRIAPPIDRVARTGRVWHRTTSSIQIQALSSQGSGEQLRQIKI
jgi:hypothetical protein